jgi:rRNA maturation endonuclease Nob1
MGRSKKGLKSKVTRPKMRRRRSTAMSRAIMSSVSSISSVSSGGGGGDLADIVAPLLRRIDHLEQDAKSTDRIIAEHLNLMRDHARDEQLEESSSSSDEDEDENEIDMKRATSDVKVQEVIKEASECVVCLNTKSTHAIVPCMHMCLCAGCASIYEKKKLKACPKCRQKCTSINKLYF